MHVSRNLAIGLANTIASSIQNPRCNFGDQLFLASIPQKRTKTPSLVYAREPS